MDTPADPALEFRSVFPAEGRNPYNAVQVGRIHDHRANLDGELFFDNILTAFAKVSDVSSHYPPHSTKSLQSLHALITTSPHLDSIKKYTLIYYLLLDLPTPAPASKFAVRVHLPQNFIELITALHHLDNLELEEALTHLTSPSIVAPVPEKILSTLFNYGTPAQVVAFVGCVQPVLETSESIEMYFKSQLAMSPEGAFLYARTSAPGYLRAKFLKLLVDYCLETDPAVNALRLINLPFDDEEKPMFVEALKASPKENARDALLVWQMHQGRLEEALKGTRKAAAKGNKGGMDWGVLGDGLQKGLGGRGGVEA